MICAVQFAESLHGAWTRPGGVRTANPAPAPLPLLRPASDRPTESLRQILLERWPGRLLLGALALRLLVWAGRRGCRPDRRQRRRWATLASLGAARRAGLLRLAPDPVAASAPALGRAPAADRLVHLHRRRAGAAHRRVLPVRRRADVPPRQRVSLQQRRLRRSGGRGAHRRARGGGGDSSAAAACRRSTRCSSVATRATTSASPACRSRWCRAPPSRATPAAAGIGPVRAGDWAHMDPPATIPAWVSGARLRRHPGLRSAQRRRRAKVQLVVRAVGLPAARDAKWGVVIDIPVDEQVLERIHQTDGRRAGRASRCSDRKARRRSRSSDGRAPRRWRRPSARVQTGVRVEVGVRLGAFLDFVDWGTGETDTVHPGDPRQPARHLRAHLVGAEPHVGLEHRRVCAAHPRRSSACSSSSSSSAAFLMGLALARSITGSVHALFYGTERAAAGRSLAIASRCRSRDQLGELADSFNAMTVEHRGSAAAGGREEAARGGAAHRPRDPDVAAAPRPMRLPGLAVTSLCVPAREVGGDYYDFFPLDEHRVGVLIADVAGKGTSAALYMAELKGLVHVAEQDLPFAAAAPHRGRIASSPRISTAAASSR